MVLEIFVAPLHQREHLNLLIARAAVFYARGGFMKSIVSFLRFKIIRLLERNCRPETFYRWIFPIACFRAALKKNRSPLPLPAIIGKKSMIPSARHSRRNYYLNNALSFFPERLASPEWFGRCSFFGLEKLLEIHRKNEPAIIAICHFGPCFLLRLWLQAAGIRAATLITGRAGERSVLNRLKDGERLFAKLPPVFYPHQLREMKKFLADGNALIIAMDANHGNQIHVPVGDHFYFRMPTGAFRLAARHGARLFPCNIIDEGRWRFRVELGRAVPEEFLFAPDFMPAGKHLLKELLPCFQAHPDQCGKHLVECFQAKIPNDQLQKSTVAA